jgi:hypothetical protein
MARPKKYGVKMTSTKNGVTFEKEGDTPPKNVPHKCIQVEKITEMHELLVGNGDPEKGLVARVLVITNQQNTMIKTLDKIDGTLDGITKKNDGLLIEITDVHVKLLGFKAEVTGKEKGEKEAAERLLIAKNLKMKEDEELRSKSRDNWYKVLTIIGLAVAIYFGVRKTNKIESVMKQADTLTNKVENMGVPVIVNPRGNTVALPDGFKLKFYPKDYLKDTIKNNSK